MKPIELTIKLTLLDKIIEAAGYLALIGFWVTTIVFFSSLPETIPVNYNELGEVYDYGPRSSIFLLPIIGTFIFFILTVLNNTPEIFDYSVKTIKDSVRKQYTYITKMTRLLKLIVVFIFFMINYKTIQTAQKTSEGLGVWFLPLILALIFIPTGYFTYKSYKGT